MRALLQYARGMPGCALGCHGRGDCHNGTCLCEIRFAGEECDGPNMPYHACIGGVFLMVAGVCAVQLTVCVAAEYRRLKAPTLLRACKVTTQKMLYMVAFLASLIRGAYFVSPSAFEESWATSLLSAYYPLLMSGSSLIVCFWAEVFHLRDIRWERPRFLSKSFLAFVTFNVISYSLLAAEVLTTSVATTSAEKKSFYQHVFNGCYAVLLLIVVIFFLIYGVEVYFKLRGEFLKETKVCTIIQERAGPSTADDDGANVTLVTKQGVRTDLAAGGLDLSQLHQSRLGLVSQAFLLIVLTALLASETLSGLWKSKVAVESRNFHDLVFRLAEIGVAVWFPCVLWNCMAPERLWLLNPRRLLSRQLDDARLHSLLQHKLLADGGQCLRLAATLFRLVHLCRTVLFRLVLAPRRPALRCASRVERVQDAGTCTKECSSAEAAPTGAGAGAGSECWICYDGARAEPLIRPCRCSGDVAFVHHDCLRRWLLESAATTDGLKCKVCNSPYLIQEENSVQWARGLTTSLALRTLACVCAAAAAAGAGLALTQLLTAPGHRLMALGAALLVCYVALRFLGTSTVSAYQRAKMSSIKILTGQEARPSDLAIISDSVCVEIASRALLDKALKGDK